MTDLVCSSLYPSYSIADQAVSELFAIGAPTSQIVVPLFTLSSLLFVAFSIGVWQSSSGSRLLRLAAIAFAASALVGIVLWNIFPMHMRGVEPTFTDTMHLILATNPFVLLSIALCLIAFRGAFKLYTGATVIILPIPAVFAFGYAPELKANLPTPGLGLWERFAQYAFQLWQVVLAIVLLRKTSDA
jgi:hypothetical membrane protein